MNLIDVDTREDSAEDSLTPIEDVKKVQIGSQTSQTTQIGSNLSLEEEVEIIRILKESIHMFAWKPTNMFGFDPNIICHHLALDATIKPVSQRE